MKTVSMEEVQAVVDLRYHFDEDGKLLLECYKHSIKAIAKKLRLKPHAIQYRLSLFHKNKPQPNKTARMTASASKLLTDQQTLNRTATLSLQARVNLFNETRPNRPQITKTDLRSLYKTRQISYKTVVSKLRQRAQQTAQSLARDQQLFRTLLTTVRRCIRFDLELIMIDESTFSSWSYNRKAWANKRVNIKTSALIKHETPIACCAAISQQRGLLTFMLTQLHYSGITFVEFLQKLRAIIDPSKTVLLLDNCSVHTARNVKDYLNEQQIRTVFNVPYCPQYNGIELYWAQAKRIFRTLNTQVKTGSVPSKPLRSIIQQALLSVPDDVVKRCCTHALKEIQRGY